MSEQHPTESASFGNDQQAVQSALFAQLVMQQSNMALMLLGKVAHPESGQTYKDVEGARLFIDQLEMIEAKTKGNLTREESALLKQSLMSLRLAFVEAVESPSAEPQKIQGQPGSQQASAASPATATATAESTGAASTANEDEHRKKFSKKY